MLIDEIKNIQGTRKDLRNFGLVVGSVILCIGLFLLYRQKPASGVLLLIGSGLFLLGIIVPGILKPLYMIWMSFSAVLGWIMTHLMLTVLFYTVVTPIGIVMKLTGGKGFHEFNFDRSKASYWNRRKGTDQTKERYKKQF